MKMRPSLEGIRFALLAALGASVGVACSGSVHDESRGKLDADGGGAAPGAGGQTSAGGRSTSSGGQPPARKPFICDQPTNPWTSSTPSADRPGGFEQCTDVMHRPAVGACWNHLADHVAPVPASADGGLVGPPVSVSCTDDAECTEHPYGYCQREVSYGFGTIDTTSCHYGCVQDADCAADQLCLCGEPVGRCVQADCRTDQDCGVTLPCQERLPWSPCGGPVAYFGCGPECQVDADCSSQGTGAHCDAGVCKNNAVCGRPFLVEHTARLASAERRSDWTLAVTPELGTLSAELRAALAAHYTEIGLMEHASVAAFARFSLELLAYGAPPELVCETTAALADETRHARLCFGFASAYGGAPVGPSALSLSGALASRSLEECVRTAFLEACVGETLAAVEVMEAAEAATDPAVKAALSGIAEDELRHAQLGFRFVAWALGTLSDADRAALAARLEDELAALSTTPPLFVTQPRELDVGLAAHGVLPARVRAELRRTTLAEVVLPCARALCRSVAVPARKAA